jgi:hypothetical protein
MLNVMDSHGRDFLHTRPVSKLTRVIGQLRQLELFVLDGTLVAYMFADNLVPKL